MEQMDNDDDAWLDGLLARAEDVPVSAALERRVLADFDRIATRWTPGRLLRRAMDAVWPGAPLWQPAAALVFSLLIGAGAAALVPLEIAEQDETAPGAFALDAPGSFDIGQET